MFNEPDSIQENASLPKPFDTNKQPPGVHHTSYEDIASKIEPQAYRSTISNSVFIHGVSPSISASYPQLKNQNSSTSSPSSMYHPVSSLSCSSAYSSAGAMQSINPLSQTSNTARPCNPLMNPSLNHPPIQHPRVTVPNGVFSDSPHLTHHTQFGLQYGQLIDSSMVTSPQKSPGQASYKRSAEDFQLQPTSRYMSGNPCMALDSNLRRRNSDPRLPSAQWGWPTSMAQQKTILNNTVGTPQEISQKAFLCSSLSSIPLERNNQSKVVRQMPYFEVPQNANYEPSEVKIEKKNVSSKSLLMPARNTSAPLFLFPGTKLPHPNSTSCIDVFPNLSSSQPTDPHYQDHQQHSSLFQFQYRQHPLRKTSDQSTEFWQSGQAVAESTPVTLQNNPTLTISPGESGYDSAELSHFVEDTNSLQTSHSLSEDFAQSDVCGKTMLRVSVGMKAGSENDLQSTDHSYFETFPLSTRASKKNRTQIVPSKRSLSYESVLESKKKAKPIRLRRYSNHESAAPEILNLALTKKLPPDRNDSCMNISSSSTLRKSLILPSLSNGSQLKAQVMIPTPDLNKFSFSNDELLQLKKVPPLDTPPIALRSEDFINRMNDTASESRVSTPEIIEILPTPHVVETSMRRIEPILKCTNTKISTDSISHRGFPVPTDESGPGKTEFASCNCIAGTDGRNDDAPYYTHLGAAESVQGIRSLFEKRTGYCGSAIRIEKVIYTGKEGKTSRGCPMAKWIIRRSGQEEKVLIVCRQRPGHHCGTAVIAVIILLWDGVARPLADFAYANFTNYVPKHGEPTERRCATNDERTCACQGFDESTSGASFSFGCSWSMYYNGCKYARSNNPNKYKLPGTKDPEAESFVGMLCEKLATVMSPLYEMVAPDAFHNQVEFEELGYECRLGEAGKKNCRPFSGVTSCMDFCAHAHKDQHNIDNGSTVVVTFTKPELRTIGEKHSDEQLHVLPLCKLDISNEEGNFEGVAEKIKSGALEILHRHHHEVRLRSKPKLSKKQKSRAKKKALDSADNSPYRRRGRPSKRCSSVEIPKDSSQEIARIVSMDPYQPNYLQNPMCYQMPPRMQRCISVAMGTPQHSRQLQSSLNGTFSPTRWPYRRPTSPEVADAESLSTQPQAVGIAKDAMQNPFILENLPSIGNFFHTGNEKPQNPISPICNEHPQPSTGDPPLSFTNILNSQTQTPISRDPAPLSCVQNTSPLYRRHSAINASLPTPLPSIKDVVMHPFHPSFSAVQLNSAEEINPSASDHAVGTPQETDSSISLKAYAAGASPLHAPGFTYHNRGEQMQQTNSSSVQAEETVIYSDSEENFLDSEIGGVAVAPGHGSVLIECAKKELHATTALHRPDRFHPSRISLVFYQHKSMNTRNHGAAEYEAKEQERKKQREEKKLESSMKTHENVATSVQSSPMVDQYSHGGFSTIVPKVKPIWNLDRKPYNSFPQFNTQGVSHNRLSCPSVNACVNNICDDQTRQYITGKTMRSSSLRLPSIDGESSSIGSHLLVDEKAQQPLQIAGWPRSIFPQCNNVPLQHAQSVGRPYVHQNLMPRQSLTAPFSLAQPQPNTVEGTDTGQANLHSSSFAAHGSRSNTVYHRQHTQMIRLQMDQAHASAMDFEQLRQHPNFPVFPTRLPSEQSVCASHTQMDMQRQIPCFTPRSPSSVPYRHPPY